MSVAALRSEPPSTSLSTMKDYYDFGEFGITEDVADFEAQTPNLKITPGASPHFSNNSDKGSGSTKQAKTAQSSESLMDSFVTAMSQRGILFEQLRQTEQETKKALLTLYLTQQMADTEAQELQRCRDNAIKQCRKDVMDKLIVRAMSTSKAEWEKEWDYEWVDSDNEATEEEPANSPEAVPPATSLQSSEPSSLQTPKEQPKPSGNASPHQDKKGLEPAENGSGDTYLFKVPEEFFRMSGPVTYNANPTQHGPLRTLKKRTRIVIPADGGDSATQASPEATRQTTRAQSRHKDLEDDLWKIVRPGNEKQPDITWLSYKEAFGEVDKNARDWDLQNPFSSS